MYRLILVLLALASLAGTVLAQESPSFDRDVKPILARACFACHGTGKKLQGELDLRQPNSILKGGDTGPSLVPGKPQESQLYQRIAAGEMPPPERGKLTRAELKVIEQWIATGATGNETGDGSIAKSGSFWSFQPPRRPPLPPVKGQHAVRTPIDAFLLAALEARGLTFSLEADRRTLIRRASLDLHGLPPSPEEVERFVSDPAPDAYEQLIDRLLLSPRYGERWARHWLDVAGYADSEGILDADYVRTAAWRYRDYVISALNRDVSYDRFLQQQIAGDELSDYWRAYKTEAELPPPVLEGLIATGYLRCASDTSRPDFVNIKNAPQYYYQTLDDTLKIVASSTMGLTLECAKCHSHKYDPISQQDYYRLQSIFMSGYRPAQWLPQVQRKREAATEMQEKAAKAHNATVDAAVAAIRKELDEAARPLAERLYQERLARLPDAIRADVDVALATAAARRTEVQKYLAEKFQKELRPDAAVLAKLLRETYPEFKSKAQVFDERIKVEEEKRRTFPEVRAFYDLPGEPKTPILRRGDYTAPGPEVSPGALPGLATPRSFTWTAPGKEAATSGRRTAFASWLTQPDHPLTARVIVNRLWLHHFGEGIVTTPDNFGMKGAPPSHPDLLDWLATELVARGWSLKAMHRVIMTSTAYRQSSRMHEPGQRIDPENRLLWRQRLRRLEAEALRDAVLSVSGSLNLEMFGPPVPMQRRGDEVVTPPGPAGQRRSIYLQVRRSQPLSLLQAFDQPVMETNCLRRSVSTVAAQALAQLNSDFLTQAAEDLAGRVLSQGTKNPGAVALYLAFGRGATAEEQAKLDAFLVAQAKQYEQTAAADGQLAPRRALADVCHMLLSSNEFAYVD